MATVEEAVELIEKGILATRKRFTLTEAAATTGLSMERTRDAMDQMIRRYGCRAQITDQNDLIYDFGDPYSRRGERTLADRWRSIESALWTSFTVVFRLWITVMLLCYFVLFAVLAVALVVAAAVAAIGASGAGRGRGGDPHRPRERRPSSGWSPYTIEAIIRLLASIFRWRTHTDRTRRRTDDRGYRYRQWEPEPSPAVPEKKSFVASVHDFVFGPERVRVDPLENEKEVATYLRQHQGIVVLAELETLAGLTRPAAELFLTDCVANFEGSLGVGEQQVLYGRFPKLLRGLGETAGGEVVHYWDEYEPEYELTGNDRARDLSIGLLNGLNLGFALLVVSGVIPDWLEATLSVPDSGALRFLLGWIPLAFSLLFFLIPILRRAGVRRGQIARKRNNRRKRLYKSIFAHRGRPQDLDEVLAFVNRDQPEEPLTRDHIQAPMDELLGELGGKLSADDGNRTLYAFPAIERELGEVARLRRELPVSELDMGQVIIDSHQPTPDA